jgi:membrane-bound metal-dependent hydrolase YbcI (DUF457 family)
VQGGVHLLTGLLLASLSKRKEYKLGAVIGAILPDIDIFILAFAYLVIGDKAEVIHRSLTHSLLFLIVVPGIIVSMEFIPKIKNKKDYDFLGLGIGLFFGFASHILLDMMYLTGIYFLWPFSSMELGFPFVPFDRIDQGIATNVIKLKLIQTTDFYTDIFFFFIPILMLSYKMDLHRKIRLPFSIYAGIVLAVTTVFVGLAFNSNITYVDHVVYLYYLGTFFLLTSVLSPILFRNVIREFKFNAWSLVIIVSLLIFSQYLFASQFVYLP